MLNYMFVPHVFSEQAVVDPSPAGTDSQVKEREAKWKTKPIITKGWLSLGGGAVEYQEHVSIEPIDSSWEGDVFRLDGGVDIRDTNDWIFKGALGVWIAGDDQEVWSRTGDAVQLNELNAEGVDLRGFVGYPLVEDDAITLSPFAGVGFHHTGFERTDFKSFEDADLSDIGTVSEDYSVYDLAFALEVSSAFTEKLSFKGMATFGYVVFSEADNNTLGKIEGDGGSIVELMGSLGYAVNANHEVFIGFRYYNQDLDGDRKEVIAFNGDTLVSAPLEWPDNELEISSFEIGWRSQL